MAEENVAKNDIAGDEITQGSMAENDKYNYDMSEGRHGRGLHFRRTT